MKTKTVIETDYSEIQSLVKKHLGFAKYNFVAVEECGNDSHHSFTVDGQVDEYEEEELQKWANGEFVGYSNNAVLNDLCRKGFIDKGEYLVTVCW